MTLRTYAPRPSADCAVAVVVAVEQQGITRRYAACCYYDHYDHNYHHYHYYYDDHCYVDHCYERDYCCDGVW